MAGFYRILLGVIAGAYLAEVLRRSLYFQVGLTQPIIEGVISLADLITMLIGLTLFFFGSKIHTMLKWVGIGCLAYISVFCTKNFIAPFTE